MRVFAIVLSGLLLALVAEARDHHISADTTVEVQEVPFNLTLTSSEPSVLPILPHEAALRARDLVVGHSRGAMLDRCRPRMRNVNNIGHGASPDGRPEACRLIGFVGAQKAREAPGKTASELQNHFGSSESRGLRGPINGR